MRALGAMQTVEGGCLPPAFGAPRGYLQSEDAGGWL